MELEIYNRHLLYRRNGKRYILDTGAGNCGIERRLDEDTMKSVRTAVQKDVDGVTGFLPSGRISISGEGIEIDEFGSRKMENARFVIPWKRFLNGGIPVVEAKINGIATDAIFDTGAKYAFSIGERKFFGNCRSCGKTLDFLAMQRHWKNLDSYEAAEVRIGGFSMMERILFIPEEELAYSEVKRRFGTDAIVDAVGLIENSNGIIIDGKEGIGIL